MHKLHQIPTLKRFSYCLAAVFVESLEARCQVDNEDVVGAAPTGDAPTTSEWSTILLPTMVWLILQILRYIMRPKWLNTLWSSGIIRQQLAGPTLVQVMACHLFSPMPSPEPVLTFCQLDHWEQTSEKSELKYTMSFIMNVFLKCRPFYQGLSVLRLRQFMK